jgi:hypothetical protein
LSRERHPKQRLIAIASLEIQKYAGRVSEYHVATMPSVPNDRNGSKAGIRPIVSPEKIEMVTSREAIVQQGRWHTLLSI